MIRRPPRSTRVRSSAASDVYKRQTRNHRDVFLEAEDHLNLLLRKLRVARIENGHKILGEQGHQDGITLERREVGAHHTRLCDTQRNEPLILRLKGVTKGVRLLLLSGSRFTHSAPFIRGPQWDRGSESALLSRSQLRYHQGILLIILLDRGQICEERILHRREC